MHAEPRELHVGKTLFVGAILAAFFVYTYFIRDVPGPAHASLRGETMGTTYEVKIVHSSASREELRRLQADIETRLAAVNQWMSTWIPDSQISRFNATLDTKPVTVSPEFGRVVDYALSVSRDSGGAFDPTVGPLVNLWGFGHHAPLDRLPTPAEIAAVREQCGYEHLEVVSSTQLRKGIPELQIDLSAVAKGYGADAISALLAERGFTDTYVEIGGEIVVRGMNQRGEPWRLGIDTPRAENQPGEELFGVVALSDRAIATSGDYRNFRVSEDGTRLSHLIDPRTGRPITNRVASVSVVAPSGMVADALATALMVMGPQAGLPWIQGMPEIEALYLLKTPNGAFEQRATDQFPLARHPGGG